MDSILSIITSRRISPSAVRPLLGGKSRFSVGFSQTSLILSTGQRGSGGEAGSAGTTSTIYCTVFFAIRQCAPPTGLPPGRDFFLCRMVSHLKGNVNLRESRVEPGKCCHCPLSTYPNSLPPRGRWHEVPEGVGIPAKRDTVKTFCVGQLNIYFAALKAATRLLAWTRQVSLGWTRTLAGPGPAARRGVGCPLQTRETGRGRPVFGR